MTTNENSHRPIDNSNMKSIIKNLKEKTDKTLGNKGRWMDSMKGWNYLDSLPYTPEKIAGLIFNTVQNTTELKSQQTSKPVIRERKAFSLVMQGELISPWRKEEALERLLVCVHLNLKNQYAVGGGKESIDLVKIDDEQNILSIIELKHDAGGGTPLYAIIELLKNFELLRKQNLHKSLKSLELLAPKSYFDVFKQSFKVFEDIVFHLNNKLQNIRIQVKFVDTDIEDINRELLNLKPDLEWKVSKKDKYDYKAILSSDDVRLLSKLLKLEMNDYKVSCSS